MMRMADGPVANLPPGMDAYGGYVNRSGIGITYPEVVVLAAAQKAHAFSFTTDGSAAQCADVESGAMSNWTGYDYGYCAVSSVNSLIAKYGRPKKLLTAHQDPRLGAHICSPKCWPGLVTTADGTQWVDHGGLWDESLLADDFFEIAPPPVQPTKEQEMQAILVNGVVTVFAASASPGTQGHLQKFSLAPGGWAVDDVTDEIAKLNPNIPLYLVEP